MKKIKILTAVVIGDGHGIGKVGEIYGVSDMTARTLVGYGCAELVDDSRPALQAPPKEVEPLARIKVLTDCALGDGRLGKVGVIYMVEKRIARTLVNYGSAELVHDGEPRPEPPSPRRTRVLAPPDRNEAA